MEAFLQFVENNVLVSWCTETLIWKTWKKNEEDKKRERVEIQQNETTVFNAAIKPRRFDVDTYGLGTA